MDRSIRVAKRNIFYLFLIVPFFPNVLPDVYHSIYNVNLVWKISSFLIISFCYLKSVIIKRKVSNLFYIAIMDMGILLLSTIFNSGSIVKYSGYFISCVGLLMLFEYAANKDIKYLVSSALFLMRFYLVLDAVLLIIYPSGLFGTSGGQRLTFLGLDNISVPFIVCFLSLSLMNTYKVHNRFYTIAVFDLLLSVLVLVVIFSGTGLLALIIIILSGFVFRNIKNIKKYIFGILASGAIFIYFYALQNIRFISDLLANLFGKDVSLSGRTVIWNEYLTNIKEHFWFGYGIRQTNQALIYIPDMWDYRLAHNEIIQHLADGGVFYLLFFTLMIIVTINKSGRKNQRATHMLSSGIIAFFFMFITETYTQNNTFFVLLFAMYFDYDLNLVRNERSSI